MEDFRDFICYEMKMTMKKIEKHFTRSLKEYSLNFAQSLILFSLLEKDGCTLSEIGNRAQIENSSLTTMADKLEKEGLVERKLDIQDRRIIRLFLTEAGRNTGQIVFAEGAAFNRRLKTILSGAEKDLLAALKELRGHLT
ncbi:MAG: MarR family transcriptional regulator [Firmicutes bacterium]|nr:MarR family transcriptional regulator [Bacillota bacterium]